MCVCVCERERERERERETENCSDWHHVRNDIFQSQSRTAWIYYISSDLHHYFLTHVEIHISELFFFVLLNPGPTVPGLRSRRCFLSTPLTASLLTDCLTLLFSLYNFLNAHTFSFWFSIYFLLLRSFWFTQLLILFWNPWLISLSKVNIEHCCGRDSGSSVQKVSYRV